MPQITKYKTVFPFFRSSRVGDKELTEENLTSPVRCLNTGNNALATSSSSTPFNLTTTETITSGKTTIHNFTLGVGKGEINGYYIEIDETASYSIEGTWTEDGVFYLKLNTSNRGLVSETPISLEYASSGEIPSSDIEKSLKIAHLTRVSEGSSTLIVEYSCHLGLLNNIDLTYGSKLKEVFKKDDIYYYLNRTDMSDWNVQLGKKGVQVKNIDSITSQSVIATTIKSYKQNNYNNEMTINQLGIYFTNTGNDGAQNVTYNTMQLSSTGTIFDSYPCFTVKQRNKTFLDIDYGTTLGNYDHSSSIIGNSIGLSLDSRGDRKIKLSTSGFEIKNGTPKITMDADNISILSGTVNGTTTLSGKNVSLTSLLSSGTTSLNGYKTTIRSKNETLIGSNTTTKIATYDATEQLTSYIKLGELGLDIEVATSKINSPGLLKIISDDVVIYEGDSWFIDITNDKTHIKSVNTTIGGTATITGATTMSSTLEVDGKITAKKQISASNVIHSDSNVTANGNVTAKGNVTANNGNDILGSGTLKLNNVAMVDFVVEEGTKTVEGFAWKFRKWKNGRYEAWCSDSYSATFIAPSGSSVKPICQAPSARTVWLPAVSNSIVYFNASVMGESPSCNCMGCSLTYNDKKAFPRPWRTDGSDTQTETTSTISLRYYVVYENVT